MSKELLTLIFNYTLAICDPNEKRSFGEIKELNANLNAVPDWSLA